MKKKPVVLCILDGWGHRIGGDDNAIANANTPHWDYLCAHFPYGTLDASEHHVGLPAGQMGNSEVGHMNIGAGRVVMQELPRIDDAITSGTLANNEALDQFVHQLHKSGGACHLMGLLSDGGVHSHMRHMISLAHHLAKAGIKVYLHAFLDGRDTPPRSAADYLSQTLVAIAGTPLISLSSLCGRYYAMDRDKRWDRVEKAYKLLTDGQGLPFDDAHIALQHCYQSLNVSDEFVPPIALSGYSGMCDGDGMLMANFRADRARQLLQSFAQVPFDGFARNRIVALAARLGMVEYSSALNQHFPAMFPAQSLNDGLGEWVAKQGGKQFRIAETEKYAHVTFFLNGGREAPFANEERCLIPSPAIATYDLQPEMSAAEVTASLCQAIESGEYDLLIVNYANPDMVGHSGIMSAAIKAVEAVDNAIGALSTSVLKMDGAMLITADHGNVEMLFDAESNQQHTAHTLNPVPYILVSNEYMHKPLALPPGNLADIAPTLLAWMGIEKPPAMTGQNLLPYA